MDPWTFIAIFTGGLIVLLIGTWGLVVRREEIYAGWRRKASLVALVLPSIALVVEVALSTMAHFLPLDELDESSKQGGWYTFLSVLWLCSHFATGVLPLCGLLSAILGRGRPRVSGAIWSFAALTMFCLSFILVVNSFH